MPTNGVSEGPVPRVSVVMPVRGPCAHVEEAVRSILAQSYRDLEMIIVRELGSDDDLERLVKDLDDERVILMQNHERLGLARSLNAGIARARGRFIARMDADDISAPERIEEQVTFLDSHPAVGVLGTHLQFIDGVQPHYDNSMLPTDPHLTRWMLHFHNAVAHPSVMMRREVWERSKGYQPEAEPCEDYDLWLRAMRFTDIMSLPEQLVAFRTDEGSVSSTRREEQKRKMQELAGRALQISLGRPIDGAIARGLIRPYSISAPREGVGAAHLLHMLYTNFQWWEKVRGRELAKIQKDIGERLSHILARSIRVGPLYSSMVLWQASRFGPKVFLKLMADLPVRGADMLRNP
jgi:hypothetical protein